MTLVKLRSLLLAPLASVLFSSGAFSYPVYLDQFSGYYEDNGINVKGLVEAEACAVCHTSSGGGGSRNAYGQDFDRVVLGQGVSFGGLEFLDSDKDSFLNLEEIFSQTSLAQADLKPVGRIELTITADSLAVLVPADCVKLELKAFGFQFDGKAVAELEKVKDSAAFKLTGDKGTILARCDAESFVGSITVK